MFPLKDLDSVAALNLSKLNNVCWTKFLIPKHQLDYKFLIDLLISKNATLPKAGGKRRGYRIREHQKKWEHQNRNIKKLPKSGELWQKMVRSNLTSKVPHFCNTSKLVIPHYWSYNTSKLAMYSILPAPFKQVFPTWICENKST